MTLLGIYSRYHIWDSHYKVLDTSILNWQGTFSKTDQKPIVEGK